MVEVGAGAGGTDFSVMVLFRSHVIMGRLRRSLYVGRRIEYLSLVCLGAILIARTEFRERVTGAIGCVDRLELSFAEVSCPQSKVPALACFGS